MDNLQKKEFTIEVKLKLEDIVHLNQTVLRGNISHKINRIVAILMVPALGYLIWSKAMGANIPTPVLLILAAVPFVSFVFTPMTVKKASYVAMKTNRALQNAQYYTVREQGIEVKSGDNVSVIGWDLVQRVEESEGYLLIFITKTGGLIIPKRCADEDRVGMLKELLVRKVDVKKLRLAR